VFVVIVSSYESMKSVCDRYNRALDSLLQLVRTFQSDALLFADILCAVCCLVIVHIF